MTTNFLRDVITGDFETVIHIFRNGECMIGVRLTPEQDREREQAINEVFEDKKRIFYEKIRMERKYEKEAEEYFLKVLEDC